MWDVFFYLAVVMVLAVLMIVGAFLLRSYLSGASPMAAVGQLFGPKPLPRVYVVEQSSLDSRRRLVLIRRDDVEHLIMTGGPVDMVIETGIGAPQDVSQTAAAPAEASAHTLPPRVSLRT